MDCKIACRNSSNHRSIIQEAKIIDLSLFSWHDRKECSLILCAKNQDAVKSIIYLKDIITFYGTSTCKESQLNLYLPLSLQT